MYSCVYLKQRETGTEKCKFVSALFALPARLAYSVHGI